MTYEIVCSKGLAADKTAIVKDFLTYFSSPDAQSKLEELGYAPLPDRTAVEGPDGGRSDPVVTSPRGGSSRRLTRDDPPPLFTASEAGRSMAVPETDATRRVEPAPRTQRRIRACRRQRAMWSTCTPRSLRSCITASACSGDRSTKSTGRRAGSSWPRSARPGIGCSVRWRPLPVWPSSCWCSSSASSCSGSRAAQPAGRPGQLPHLA